MKFRECLAGGLALPRAQKEWVELLSGVKSGAGGCVWRGGLLPLIIKALHFAPEHPAGPSSPLTDPGTRTGPCQAPGFSLTPSFQVLTRREGTRLIFVSGWQVLNVSWASYLPPLGSDHDFSKSVLSECMILGLEVGVVLEG